MSRAVTAELWAPASRSGREALRDSFVDDAPATRVRVRVRAACAANSRKRARARFVRAEALLARVARVGGDLLGDGADLACTRARCAGSRMSCSTQVSLPS